MAYCTAFFCEARFLRMLRRRSSSVGVCGRVSRLGIRWKMWDIMLGWLVEWKLVLPFCVISWECLIGLYV